MGRNRQGWIFALAFLVLPSLAFAGGRLAVKMDNQEVNVASPAAVGFFLDSGHTFGLSAEYAQPFREDRWTWNLGAGFGRGSYKQEGNFTPTVRFKDMWNYSTVFLRGGVDREVDLGPARMSCGTGLIYRSSSVEVEQQVTGSPTQTEKSEPYTLFGLNNRLTTAVPVSSNENLELYGEFNNTMGFGSAEDGDDKISQWDSGWGYAMGVRMLFK